MLNKTFNLLTVIERAGSDKNKKALWKCQCNCGNTVIVRGTDLRRGHTKSCGCSREINEIGNVYGSLEVVSKDNTDNKSGKWLCKCNCGNPHLVSVSGNNLRRNKVLSCGYCQNIVDETNNTYNKLTVVARDWERLADGGAFWLCKCSCGNPNLISVYGSNLRRGHTTSCGCVLSRGESLISTILDRNNIIYKRQYSFVDLCGKQSSLKFDFAIFDNSQNLICLIEYQGQQHYDRPFCNDLLKYEKTLLYDEKKRQYCKDKKIPLIEIPFTDYNKICDGYLLERIGYYKT